MSRSIRVLHVCSIVQEQTNLLPVPPVAGGAPSWNVYRTYEALAAINGASVEGEVVSACTPDQQSRFAEFDQHATYHHVVLPQSQRQLSNWFNDTVPLAPNLLRRTISANSWLTYRYLSHVLEYWKSGPFDLMILDDAPQNLLYLSHFVPKEKLIFLVRGEIGMSRNLLDRVGMIIATNDNLADYVRSILPDGASPEIGIVPNSLGEEFQPDQNTEITHPKDQNQIEIIFAGRVVADKGVRELLRAFTLVHKQFPHTHLRIVGGAGYDDDGTPKETDYQRELKAIAAQIGEDAVTFAGFMPYHEMPAQYAAADIAVFPSVWVEGFGMVALEAMSTGLPVVVSNRPGFMSFVRDGENGLVVNDPENIEDLAQKIITLIENENMAKRLGAAARETARQYTPQAAAQQFIDVICTYTTQRG